MLVDENYRSEIFCLYMIQLPNDGIRLMMHSPNGGYRKPSDAARFRSIGVRAVVRNILLTVDRGCYQGLWIAIKRRRGGRVSVEQARWMDAMKKRGYYCAVCYGWNSVVAVIQGYIRGGGIWDSERR